MTNKRISQLNRRNEIIRRGRLNQPYAEIAKDCGVSISHVSEVCRKYGNIHRQKSHARTTE